MIFHLDCLKSIPFRGAEIDPRPVADLKRTSLRRNRRGAESDFFCLCGRPPKADFLSSAEGAVQLVPSERRGNADDTGRRALKRG